MAEVSNLHRMNHHGRLRSPPPSRRTNSMHHLESQPQEEEFYDQGNPFVLDFDSLHPFNSSSDPFFIDDYTAPLNIGYDLDDEEENPGREYEDPNCFFYGGEEFDEQMNFVTDLFESRESQAMEDPLWEFDSAVVEGSEFGFGPGLGPRLGLRVVGMDSESDSEEFVVNSGSINNDEEENYDGFGAGFRIREDFEWEEVNEAVNFDERENLNSIIHRIEELPISSDMSSSEHSRVGDDEEDEEHQNTDWEVLLAVNMERNMALDQSEDMDYNEIEVPHINLPEDYVLAMEYDTLFSQLVENENAFQGSPPAAKSVVENLPSVVLTKDEMEENNTEVVCAVCKDEVSIGEKVTKMPCFHLYHGECIIPWLKIRNTCPVCRFELPTDDADYERRRSERSRSGNAAPLINDFEGRYNFEVLP